MKLIWMHVAIGSAITLFLHYNVIYECFSNHVGEHKNQSMKEQMTTVQLQSQITCSYIYLQQKHKLLLPSCKISAGYTKNMKKVINNNLGEFTHEIHLNICY